MNTRIRYLYRDASNYKVHHECVIIGEITDEQIESIINTLDGGLWFKAEMVCLPDKRFEHWTYNEEDDHPWFELSKYGFEVTEDSFDIDITVNEIVGLFHEAAERGWEEPL